MRFVKFGMVGVLNTAIDLAVFSALYFVLGVPLLIANTCAVVVAATNSYLVNKYWTFRDPSAGRDAVRAGVVFFALNLAGLGLANLTIWLLSTALPIIVAKGVSMVMTTLWNYWSCNRFVYRSGDDTPTHRSS